MSNHEKDAIIPNETYGYKLNSANIGGLTIRKHPEGIVFKVRVQPKSSKNAVVGLHGDALKIKLTAPPVDNAANAMCVKFLAKALGVSKSSVEIIAGHTSRNKQVLLKADQRSITAGEHKHLEQLVEKLAGSKRGLCSRGQKSRMIKK